MTSLAFIFGVLPLAISTGAGAQSRIAIGTAVIGGMITGTVLAMFFVPLFFVLIRRIGAAVGAGLGRRADGEVCPDQGLAQSHPGQRHWPVQMETLGEIHADQRELRHHLFALHSFRDRAHAHDAGDGAGWFPPARSPPHRSRCCG